MSDQSVSRDRAQHYTWGEGCDGWHLLSQAELSVIEESMPAGSAEVWHYHEKAQQFFYVLAGEAIMELAGKSIPLVRGEGVHIPPGAPHRIRNDSAEAVEFLVISQPPSHGDRVTI